MIRTSRALGLCLALAALMAVGTGTAQAQKNQNQNARVGQIVSGLINVNIGAVMVNIDDITVADLIDVEDVLNDNEIRILNNVLNRSPILSNNSEILTNLLQDAEILNENQVVVGVLSNGLFLIQEL